MKKMYNKLISKNSTVSAFIEKMEEIKRMTIAELDRKLTFAILDGKFHIFYNLMTAIENSSDPTVEIEEAKHNSNGLIEENE